METIINVLVGGLAFFVGGQLLSGVKLNNYGQAILVAILVAILDLTLGTVLKIVTLGILSLGIFNWLLNAILILVADWFLKDFEVKNMWWAIALAAIVSITTSLVSVFL
jgi:putative membrane protein